jgi:hypothetical protein
MEPRLKTKDRQHRCKSSFQSYVGSPTGIGLNEMGSRRVHLKAWAYLRHHSRQRPSTNYRCQRISFACTTALQFEQVMVCPSERTLSAMTWEQYGQVRV